MIEENATVLALLMLVPWFLVVGYLIIKTVKAKNTLKSPILWLLLLAELLLASSMVGHMFNIPLLYYVPGAIAIIISIFFIVAPSKAMKKLQRLDI